MLFLLTISLNIVDILIAVSGPKTVPTDKAPTDEAPPRDDENGETDLPDFGQYLYFLFCPTLVYKDQYPM